MVAWPQLKPEELDNEASEEAPQKVHIASRIELSTNEELAHEPPDPASQGGWLDSDDAPVSADGCSVELRGASHARQTVLSRDWVHVDHEVPVRSWTVYAAKATYDFGDIYWGFTEAQCFSQQRCPTYLFDVRGNVRWGDSPLDIVLCEARRDVERMDNATFEGEFNGSKDDRLTITLDLKQQTMVISNMRTNDKVRMSFAGAGVRCARLCASLRTAGDRLVIEQAGN